jgi:hypothetical protein
MRRARWANHGRTLKARKGAPAEGRKLAAQKHKRRTGRAFETGGEGCDFGAAGHWRRQLQSEGKKLVASRGNC